MWENHTGTNICHSFQGINRIKCLLSFFDTFLVFYCRLEGRVLRFDSKKDANDEKI